MLVAVLASTSSSTRAFVPVVKRSAVIGLRMAIDYNDPVVAEEFAKVQPMAFEDVEEELSQTGIRVPPTMKYVHFIIYCQHERQKLDQLTF